MRIMTKESVSLKEAWYRLYVDMYIEWKCQRGSQKNRKRTAHVGKNAKTYFPSGFPIMS